MTRTSCLALLVTVSMLAQGPLPVTQEPAPEPEPSGIRLIIRGDDFGDTHASNVALERAFGTGVMTSASLLVASPWFTETAELVRSHPEWSVGVHLSVTSEWDRLRWGPLALVSEVPSLVAEDGNLFHSYPNSPLALEYLDEGPPYLFASDEEMPASILARRRLLTSSQLPAASEVEVELRAQIERARRLGMRIDYLDCHQGVVCLPSLAPVMEKLADELCVPISEPGWLGSSDVQFFHRGDLPKSVGNFVMMLDSLKPGLYRLILHPNVDAAEVHARDSYFGPKYARSGQHELDILAAEEVKAAIERNSVELVSIRDLWDYEECRSRFP